VNWQVFHPYTYACLATLWPEAASTADPEPLLHFFVTLADRVLYILAICTLVTDPAFTVDLDYLESSKGDTSGLLD
jgi:hypothetical protein